MVLPDRPPRRRGPGTRKRFRRAWKWVRLRFSSYRRSHLPVLLSTTGIVALVAAVGVLAALGLARPIDAVVDWLGSWTAERVAAHGPDVAFVCAAFALFVAVSMTYRWRGFIHVKKEFAEHADDEADDSTATEPGPVDRTGPAGHGASTAP